MMAIEDSVTDQKGQKLLEGALPKDYIRVKNISLLYEEFKHRQTPFGYELTQQPWGMNEMQVNDPYGNAIRFGEVSD